MKPEGPQNKFTQIKFWVKFIFAEIHQSSTSVSLKFSMLSYVVRICEFKSSSRVSSGLLTVFPYAVSLRNSSNIPCKKQRDPLHQLSPLFRKRTTTSKPWVIFFAAGHYREPYPQQQHQTVKEPWTLVISSILIIFSSHPPFKVASSSAPGNRHSSVTCASCFLFLWKRHAGRELIHVLLPLISSFQNERGWAGPSAQPMWLG